MVSLVELYKVKESVLEDIRDTGDTGNTGDIGNTANTGDTVQGTQEILGIRVVQEIQVIIRHRVQWIRRIQGIHAGSSVEELELGCNEG